MFQIDTFSYIFILFFFCLFFIRVQTNFAARPTDATSTTAAVVAVPAAAATGGKIADAVCLSFNHDGRLCDYCRNDGRR